MASTRFLCSPIQSFDPFSKTKIIKSKSNRMARTAVRATKREDDNQEYLSGKLVDKSLIVLRMRIHEMKKMSEGINYEAPKEWMDWEKQVYKYYDSTICDAMGHLQSYLMETRPCLALGMVALVAISVPTSSALVMFHFLELIKGLFAGIHL